VTVTSRAVFLSYASEDAEAAARICEALRAAGVEVWFDKSELRGGDAWDLQIKKQIHDCALFLPLISASTNARIEGYFRREWKLATRRLLDRADNAAFLIPVVVDDTREADALVPEEFFHAQWTRLPGGETPPAFALRVHQLLGEDDSVARAVRSAVDASIESNARSVESARSVPRFGRDRGKQRIRAIGFIALCVILGGVLWYYERPIDQNSTAVINAADPKQSTSREATILRLAVMPLENQSPDPANAFFADGLHDEILSAMSATPDLQVVSRTTMRTYAGSQKTVKQIAAELGASHLLEGAVRRAGDQVRLTLQLVDTASDSNVWSRTFDRQLGDALNLQSEVAMEVATALDVRLSQAHAKDEYEAATNKSVPKNPIAFDLYLKGKLQLASYSQVLSQRDFDRFEGLLTRAIELDPGYAGSYALRARGLLWRLWYLGHLTDGQWRMIGSDIESASRLAGATADVLAAQIYFEYYGKMDYVQAREATRVALGRYPNNLDLRELDGYLLRRLGRWDDAIATFQSLFDREPANSTYVGALAECLLSVRRYGQVLSVVREYERHGSPDFVVASYAAYATEAITREPDARRRYLDTWRDRIDPSFAWVVELDYLRNAGQTDALALHLLDAKADFISDSPRYGAGLMMPVAVLQGYGRLLQGASNARAEARALEDAAAHISRLPSREWNIALVEANSSLFLGDKRRAVEHANRALQLMTVERDALIGPTVIGAAATVMAWAGQGNEAVKLLRQANAVPNNVAAWAMIRDPVFAVPLTGNPAFEALKREFDTPQ